MFNNVGKKWIAVLLSACMIFGLASGTSYVKADIPVTTYYVGGAGASDSNTGVGPYATLAKAANVINASGGAVNTIIVKGDTYENHEINIHKNVTIIGSAVSGSAIIVCPAISVWEDGSLILGNPSAASDQELIIDSYGNGYAHWGAVANFGYFELNSGVTIQQVTRTGVLNYGTMLMKGGIIENSNYGILNYRYLTMTGGIIRNNHNNYFGGGVMNYREFTMNGGIICDNSSILGGGVFNFSSFHMGGNAIITRNSAVSGGGIYDDNDIYFAHGVYYFGDDMTISGGTISENTATIGGAIYAGSSFELSGSASIPAGIGRLHNIYLCDRLVVKDNWNFSEEIALRAPLYCEELQLLEINPTLMAANRELFYLENEKYDFTNEGKLTLHNKSNVSVNYVNGSTGNDITGNGSSLQPYATIGKAVTEIESTVDRTGIVYLQSDIELAGTVTILGDITLLSQGTHSITRSDLFTGLMFEIYGGLKLGATDNSGSNQYPTLIFDGESDQGRIANGPVLYNLGILEMYSGVIIRNNNFLANFWSYYEKPACVSNRNIFQMHGGLIHNNAGLVGGVYSDKTFRMEGGSIQDNIGIYDEAGHYYGNGGVHSRKYFCMTGGSITNNEGDQSGGVYSLYYTSFFEMKGGEISGNYSHNQGGGVNSGGNFQMSGGIITGNQSGTGYSDGVYQSSLIPLTLSGNAVITPDNEIGINYCQRDSGEMSVTEIMIDGTLTGTLPGTNEPAVFKVNNDFTELGATVFRFGTNYHYTWEDALRFIFNNSQPQEYGVNADGRLCPLLTGENITILKNNIYYNGSGRRIDNIVVKYNDDILTENIDYRVIYNNNINAGDYAQVKIQGMGSYSGVYFEYFTIRPSYIQRIITAKPADLVFTAGQQMTINRMQELFTDNVEVYTDAGTVSLPMLWNLSSKGEYNPKGGSYQFSGRLAYNPNLTIPENTQLSVSCTVNPSVPVNPEFSRADAMKSTLKRATPTKLGEALLPTTGYVDLEGYQLGYRITWDYDVLNTTDVAAHTKFTGTIEYINPPEWVTLPEDLKVSRTIGVYELMEETLKFNNSEETYQARITREEEQGSLIALYDITKVEMIQPSNLANGSLLPQLEIPISANKRLLKLMFHAAFKDMKLSFVIPSDLLSDPLFDTANINLDPALLKAAKESGKDITIAIQDESGREVYSWTFTSKNLTNSKHTITGVNLSLSVDQVNHNEELKDLLLKEQGLEADDNLRGLVIKFGHQGVLPSKADVRIYVGDREDFKPGDRVYLYHVNEKSGLLETLPYSSSYKVDKDGYITIHIVHCSEYAVLPKKAAGSIVVSLRDQIQVTPVSKTLYYGGGQNSKVKINIRLPETLELINSFNEKTSSGAMGAVKVTYRSSNTGVASVNKDGIITAKGPGTANLYVKVTLYSGKSKVVTMKIKVKR